MKTAGEHCRLNIYNNQLLNTDFNPFVVGSIPAHPTKIQKTARRNVSRFSFLDAERRLSFSLFLWFSGWSLTSLSN